MHSIRNEDDPRGNTLAPTSDNLPFGDMPLTIEDNLFPSQGLSALLYCTCKERYSIEPHGKGHAIYWGRCQHKHGANLALITECSREDLIKHFEEALNRGPS